MVLFGVTASTIPKSVLTKRDQVCGFDSFKQFLFSVY